jgi:DNA (cytosine-5)-methyltransferase 1
MGVPQTRHRVFFVALRDDVDCDLQSLNMSFNYEPVTYGEIKAGIGDEIGHNTLEYRTLSLATPQDRNLADVYRRLGEKERRYSAAVLWDENICPTILAQLFHYRGVEKTKISVEDIIHAQTFPEDYDFDVRNHNNVAYICGMSVPPVMIKRIVQRLIESGVFSYKEAMGK